MNERNNNRLVIMGCGYIGQRVADLLPAGKMMAVVRGDNSFQACTAKHIPAVKMDLDEESSVADCAIDFGQARILYLIPPPRSGLYDARIQRFLVLLKKQQPEKIVLISTTGIYGDCQGEWINETTPPNPQADRARRRLDAESQLSAFCDDREIPFVILRVPGIYGPGKLPIKRIQSGEPVLCAEDSGFSNRIHADDLANICVEALLSDEIQGVYNCADGAPSTMNDYFMKLADALGLPRPPEISLDQARQQLSAGMNSYLAESKRISNEKLRRDFKYSLQYPDLDSGLKNI